MSAVFRIFRKVFAALAALASLTGAAQADPLIVSRVIEARQALDALTAAALNQGYQLVKVQPIDSAMTKRGLDNPHVRLLFVGNKDIIDAAQASAPDLLQLLPLRLTLVIRRDEVAVMSDDFAPWKAQFGQPAAQALLTRMEADVRAILAEFAAHGP